MKHYVKFILLSVSIIGSVMSSQARAATATTTFPVTATVLTSCLVTATPLIFGNYDPTSATALDATTTLVVLCTVGTSFTVGLNPGSASGATVTSRRMANGANTLNYALYRETARTNNWGNTPGSDTPASVVAAILPSTLTVYGRIPSGQNVAPGAYVDTVTVTVNY